MSNLGSSNVLWTPHDVEGMWVGEARGFSEQNQETLMITGGVHGNEHTAIEIIRDIISGEIPFNLDAGRVILGLGNLAAIEADKRFTDVNLNRQFKELTEEQKQTDPAQWPYEVRRAQAMLPSLRNANALLDLHDFTNPNDPIFMITEERGFAIARKIGAPFISSGWSTAEPGGSDSYMESQGKVGICYELGHKDQPKVNRERGLGAIARFLAENEMLDVDLVPMYSETGQQPRFIRNEGSMVKRTKSPYELYLRKDVKTFDRLEPGQKVALLDGKLYLAEEGQVIIFPEPPAEVGVGEEAFIFGREFYPAAA